MNHWIALGSSLILAVMSTLASSGDKAPDNNSKPPRLYEGQVYVALPEAIRRDLHGKAVRLARSVYPEMEADALRKRLEPFLLEQKHLITGMHTRRGPWMSFGKGVPGMSMSFPRAEDMGIGTKEPPPGTVLDKHDEPLTIEEAQRLATQVMRRLTEREGEFKDLEMIHSGWRQHDDVYYFEWQSRSTSPETWGRAVTVEVRKKDGLTTHVDLRHALPRPALSFDEAVKIAKASFKDFDPKYLRPSRLCHAGITRMTWWYSLPAPAGGSSRDDTYWDATTGELLFSIVLRGGKPGKPYKNPTFYTEVNDELYKRNIEKLIRDRVAELEKKKE